MTSSISLFLYLVLGLEYGTYRVFWIGIDNSMGIELKYGSPEAFGIVFQHGTVTELEYGSLSTIWVRIEGTLKMHFWEIALSS